MIYYILWLEEKEDIIKGDITEEGERMARKKKNWIQKAVKHKGSLRKWAEKHGFITKRGTIDLEKAKKYAEEHNLTHRVRQINLAMTLRKIRRKK